MVEVKMNRKLLLALVLIGTVVSMYYIYQRRSHTNENNQSWTEFISSPQYLSACREINPNIVKQQANFHNLLPGKTSLQQTVDIFGEPAQITSFGNLRQLHYPDFTVNFVKDSDLIAEIHVYGVQEMNTLLSFILEFGCPDLIYAFDEAEEPTGYFNSVYFYFSNIGLELYFADFPIKLNQISRAIGYYQPALIGDYMTTNKAVFGIKNKVQIVSWKQAVK